eukprot:TRINITY_DN2422_c0_g11_i1.p1 TRINITY_DN2422_c0_g11~~TRINITY_DN2422_c0_g11_i1.p1  ORF type:complete len:1119 (-),score=206.48 TRINITY_DN2422_c0_g11_i1:104-3460(-)
MSSDANTRGRRPDIAELTMDVTDDALPAGSSSTFPLPGNSQEDGSANQSTGRRGGEKKTILDHFGKHAPEERNSNKRRRTTTTITASPELPVPPVGEPAGGWHYLNTNISAGKKLGDATKAVRRLIANMIEEDEDGEVLEHSSSTQARQVWLLVNRTIRKVKDHIGLCEKSFEQGETSKHLEKETGGYFGYGLKDAVAVLSSEEIEYDAWGTNGRFISRVRDDEVVEVGCYTDEGNKWKEHANGTMTILTSSVVNLRKVVKDAKKQLARFRFSPDELVEKIKDKEGAVLGSIYRLENGSEPEFYALGLRYPNPETKAKTAVFAYDFCIDKEKHLGRDRLQLQPLVWRKYMRQMLVSSKQALHRLLEVVDTADPISLNMVEYGYKRIRDLMMVEYEARRKKIVRKRNYLKEEHKDAEKEKLAAKKKVKDREERIEVLERDVGQCVVDDDSDDDCYQMWVSVGTRDGLSSEIATAKEQLDHLKESAGIAHQKYDLASTAWDNAPNPIPRAVAVSSVEEATEAKNRGFRPFIGRSPTEKNSLSYFKELTKRRDANVNEDSPDYVKLIQHQIGTLLAVMNSTKTVDQKATDSDRQPCTELIAVDGGYRFEWATPTDDVHGKTVLRSAIGDLAPLAAPDASNSQRELEGLITVVARSLSAINHRKLSAGAEDRDAVISARNTRPYHLIFIATEWKSRKGGLSTFNRMLCTELASQRHRRVGRVTCLILANPKDVDPSEAKAAANNGVVLMRAPIVKEDVANGVANSVEVCRFAMDHRGAEEWRDSGWRKTPWRNLSDGVHRPFLVGHGHVTGYAASTLADRRGMPYVYICHTLPERLAYQQDHADPVQHAQEKVYREMDVILGKHELLTKRATLVCGVGSKITDAWKNRLSRWKDEVKVFCFIPGLISCSESARGPPDGNGKILMLGRTKDARQKGIPAVSEIFKKMGRNGFENLLSPNRAPKLVIRGVEPGNEEDQQLRGLMKSMCSYVEVLPREYCTDPEMLMNDRSEASLFLFPVRAEGFGLAALEAISYGIPTLVSADSGLGDALTELRTVDSDVLPMSVDGLEDTEAEEWVSAISKAMRHRKTAFERAKRLRESYDSKFKWEGACSAFLDELGTALQN